MVSHGHERAQAALVWGRGAPRRRQRRRHLGGMRVRLRGAEGSDVSAGRRYRHLVARSRWRGGAYLGDVSVIQHPLSRGSAVDRPHDLRDATADVGVSLAAGARRDRLGTRSARSHTRAPMTVSWTDQDRRMPAPGPSSTDSENCHQPRAGSVARPDRARRSDRDSVLAAPRRARCADVAKRRVRSTEEGGCLSS